MRALKKINNNFALCLDDQGTEMIVYGIGVGFGKFPCDISLSKIERTYYDLSTEFQTLLVSLPNEIIQISMRVIHRAQAYYRMDINSNVVIILADYINLAIERLKKGIQGTLPFHHDIEHLYVNELELGDYCVKLVWDEMKIRLDRQEAIGVAMHFINNTTFDEDRAIADDELEVMTKIIEDFLKIKIDRDSYDYYRYCCHTRRLIKQVDQQELFAEVDSGLFEHIKEISPVIFECSQKLISHIKKEYQMKIDQEKQLYLITHLNRLNTN